MGLGKTAGIMMERILFKKIELWLVIIFLLAWMVGTILFGWAVKYTVTGGKRAGQLGKIAVELASIPSNLKVLYEKGVGIEDGKIVQKNTQILDYEHDANFTQIDKTFKDDGILLVSAYSKESSVSTVYLYDIRDNRKIWEWVPDPETIVEASPSLISAKKNGVLLPIHTRTLFRSQHPYLLEDGSIVLSGGDGPLARINACGKIVWVIDRQFHHSIEGFEDNLIVPIVSRNNQDNDIGKNYRDDGYAIVTKEGKIIKETSIIDILKRGGYEGLLFGQSIRDDRIHLNDAEVISRSDKYVKAGDIMLSARNLSTVFLYRPSRGEIVWLKTGPWLSQHDVDYLGNGKFAIFGNDVDASGGDFAGRKNSNIYVYDMKNDRVYKPYEAVFRDNKLLSPTEGRQRILGNGDVFLEITARGELFRASSSKLRWRYVHRISNSEIGALHWARYFNREEINLNWVKSAKCEQGNR